MIFDAKQRFSCMAYDIRLSFAYAAFIFASNGNRAQPVLRFISRRNKKELLFDRRCAILVINTWRRLARHILDCREGLP